MNQKKIRSTIIIGIILVSFASMTALTVSATSYRRVSGYLYIDDEIASNDVLVILSFETEDLVDNTNENGHYQIDFVGHIGETGYFTVTYNNVDFTPTPDHVDIEEDSAYNVNLSINTSQPDNDPPYTPNNPNPDNNAIDVSVIADLSWTGGDPDGDSVVYDVYLEEWDLTPDVLVSDDQTGTTYDPGIMSYGAQYCWKIVAKDEHGAITEGPIWSFTTQVYLPLPPYIPSNPNPNDGKTDVSINADLSWTGGDPNPGDTVKYDLYFGTSNPPSLKAEDLLVTEYDPGTMAVDTYYWKIIAVDNNSNSTEGPIWSFTTSESSPPPPPPPEDNDPPTANASASETTGIIGIPVNFDGSLSFDSDGEITGYKWDFDGDGTYDTDWSTNAKTTHTYSSIGVYKVKLLVKDNEGGTDTDEIQVTISASANNPPTAPVVSGQTEGTINTDYSFTAVSTDLDGDDIRYIFYWADGSPNTETDFAVSNEEVVVTHKWATAGLYPVLVYAEDSNSSSSEITKKLIFIDIDYELQDDGTYLLDNDRDGSWDQVYNPVSGETEDYKTDEQPSPSDGSEEESKEDDAVWTYLIIVTVIIILLLAILVYYTKRQEGNKPKE